MNWDYNAIELRGVMMQTRIGKFLDHDTGEEFRALLYVDGSYEIFPLPSAHVAPPQKMSVMECTLCDGVFVDVKHAVNHYSARHGLDIMHDGSVVN